MSQLNINDLPSELLTKIFRMLDGVDLKNATLACKLWNNLIESGCRWSVSVYYNGYGQSYLPPSDEQKMDFIVTTKRRFGKIKITNGRLSEDNQMFEIFRRQGFNVVELLLSNCRIDNRAVFAQLLKLTPNLESLDIGTIKIDNLTDVPLDPVLPELKKLKILHMPQSPIIECFRNAKLTTIRIEYEDNIEQDMETEPLVDFLSSQPTLTSLTIEHCCSRLSPRSILVQMGNLDVSIPFRLTKLGILGLGYLYSSQYHENLVRFIKSQAESLTEVDLEWNISISVYEYVFGSLTKLRTLFLSLDDMHRYPDFYDRLKENRSVCTLVLSSFDFDRPLDEILKRLPNIRRLILPVSAVVRGSALAVVAQHLDRLESLSMDAVRYSIGYVKFGNLRTLHIGHLLANIDWNEFTKANPRLVELIIEYVVTSDGGPPLTSDDIDQITTNVDLQYLRLGVGFVADDRFFEIIRAKCTNLKVLELHRSCVPHGLRHNVEINVLRLCEKIDSPTWYSSDDV